MSEAKIFKLKSGMTLIVEEMPAVKSAAYDLTLPGGIVYDKDDSVGASLVLGELTSRGAGPYDARGLSEAFEESGINHGEGAELDRYSYRGVCLSENLPEALRLVSLMVREPKLPGEEIEGIQNLLLQDIASLDDNPSKKVMIELFSKYFPAPYNRPSIGSEPGISAADLNSLRALWAEQFKPNGAVLSVAGNVKAEALLALVEKLFSDWSGEGPKEPAFTAISPFAARHIQTDSSQLQIALAFPGPKFGDPSYYAAKVASNILSGGMFGRLFIEVREKRGLCYSVYLRHASTQHAGTVTVYAGTTPERAHETLDVIIAELGRLKGSASEEEINRAKANIKASLIIGEESSSSRASSNSADWKYLRRVRSMQEIAGEIARVGKADIDHYLERFPCKPFFLTTLGGRDITKEVQV